MKKSIFSFGLVLLMVLSIGGCIKPFDKPEYKDIKANETAFVIPLEGDTTKQTKFESVEMLEKAKVAAKRIQITHRWNKTGRLASSGEWIGNIMVIIVNRSPVTREWTAETSTGTVAKDQGIWSESKDSVGFSTGITITAMVLEEDTSLFLYRYPAQSIADVMDSEIKARVQMTFSEFSGQYDMSSLREKKSEILQTIRSDIVPFFKDRGITVTTVGQFGGFSYENPKVQESIDNVFIAQREKEVNAALLAAQTDKNAKMEMEGMGIAKKLIEEAKGKKAAAITAAEGESEAIRMVALAAKEAASNPLFLQLRKLEVQQKQIAQWNGKYPNYYLNTGNGNGPMFMLPVPSPEKASIE